MLFFFDEYALVFVIVLVVAVATGVGLSVLGSNWLVCNHWMAANPWIVLVFIAIKFAIDASVVTVMLSEWRHRITLFALQLAVSSSCVLVASSWLYGIKRQFSGICVANVSGALTLPFQGVMDVVTGLCMYVVGPIFVGFAQATCLLYKNEYDNEYYQRKRFWLTAATALIVTALSLWLTLAHLGGIAPEVRGVFT